MSRVRRLLEELTEIATPYELHGEVDHLVKLIKAAGGVTDAGAKMLVRMFRNAAAGKPESDVKDDHRLRRWRPADWKWVIDRASGKLGVDLWKLRVDAADEDRELGESPELVYMIEASQVAGIEQVMKRLYSERTIGGDEMRTLANKLYAITDSVKQAKLE